MRTRSALPGIPTQRALLFVISLSSIPGPNKLRRRLSSEATRSCESRRSPDSMDEKLQRSSLYNRSLAWLSRSVASPKARPRCSRLVVTGAIIFLAAFGVRLILWQDYQLNIGADQGGLVSRYKQQAQRMLDGDGILYTTGYQQHASVQLL